jgi:phage gp46-like protein
MGSGLHSLSGNTTNENLRLAEDAAREALEWLVADGVISDLTVTSSYSSKKILLHIELIGPNGCSFTTSANEVNYRWVWNGYVSRN